MFEKIHRNKFWAYVDGLLCGAILTYFIAGYRKERELTIPLDEANRLIAITRNTGRQQGRSEIRRRMLRVLPEQYWDELYKESE